MDTLLIVALALAGALIVPVLAFAFSSWFFVGDAKHIEETIKDKGGLPRLAAGVVWGWALVSSTGLLLLATPMLTYKPVIAFSWLAFVIIETYLFWSLRTAVAGKARIEQIAAPDQSTENSLETLKARRATR